MLANMLNQLTRQKGRLKQTMLKALLIVDEKENVWLLDGRFNESIDCHLIDLETLGVDTEDLQHALQIVAEQGAVLLMDSALGVEFRI
jgi:hypothetical protein